MVKNWGRFVDGQLLEGPCVLPTSWRGTGGHITGFNLLEETNPSLLNELNWYEVYDPEVPYDPDYEMVTYSGWYLEGNLLKREYLITYIPFESALTVAFGKLDKNRELYEVSGHPYNYYGFTVIVMTDKESSQGKLTAAQISANSGVRQDTDAYKFINPNDGSTIVVQLSNSDLIAIADYIYRRIQDSYNLTSQIAWQMLSCGDTQTLKSQIFSGSINLNPWGASGGGIWQL